ncbi:MAG: 3-hydroxyacyl-ACP dehydratase FabZ [Pseudomonadota bacterium]
MNEAIQPASRLEDLDIDGIKALIPHRHPFLLLDRVVDIVLGETAVGLKNITINEPQFQGHFPDQPIMPGVLIIEIMAQTAACLAVATVGPAAKGKPVYFMAIDQARFRRPVVPGDQLRVKVTKIHKKLSIWKFLGEATVDGAVVAQATMSARIMDA